jgi:pyruvate/2-oxoglutarate dehydrogenase complex dihydrolipoamide dehydrogenase (E3) component
MHDPYDLITIGAGSTGLTTADFAVGREARVAVVEKQEV